MDGILQLGARVEALEFPLRRLEFFPLGHVSDNGGEQQLAVGFELRDRHVCRELTPVLPAAAHFPPLAHQSGGLAGAAERLHVSAVGLVDPRGEEQIEGLADGLRGVVPEELGRAAVEQDDPLPGVNGDDPILGNVEDVGQPAPGSLKLAPDPASERGIAK